MNLPKTLRILGKRWSLIQSETFIDDDSVGLCDPEDCAIHLFIKMNHQQQRDTLIHEITHAIDHTVGTGLTEKQVHAISAGWYAVIRENKGMMQWLMRDL